MTATSSFKFLLVLGLFFLFADLAVVSGQFDGGGFPGGGGGPGGLEGDIIDAVNQGGGVPGGGINDAFGVGLQEDLLGGGDIAIPRIPNQRDQAFVGVSASSTAEGRDEFRFVGTINEAFGGNGAASGPAGGQGGFAGAGGLGAGGLGAGMNGFRVQRPQAIRSRVVPGFSSRPLSPNFVSTRFNQRISNLPVTRDFADSIRVTMQGRTAIISGTALSPQQIDRVTRQLRLEPGVTKIINQAEVGQ